jgi:predicted ferric reductase
MLATVHMFTVEATPGRSVALSSNRPLMVYMAVLTGLGIAAFLYKAFILPIVSRRNTFSVRSVDRPSDRVLEIELSPTARRVDFAPGQFVFVTFDQRGLSREAHPFTICSVPEDEGIVLTVKALGDFTEALHRRLRAGTKAWVEGPYGRFDYRSGSSAQIWLGAGVGIAPFLSWARHLERSSEQGRRATLYYCVRDRSDAVHFEEFRRIADRLRNLDVTLVCSREQGHVRAADLEPVDGKDIFMCGPRRFTTDLKSQLLRLGVPEKRIHYEDFEFR